MTTVEDFSKKLFTTLANVLIHEENPDYPEENLNISENEPDILQKNVGSTEENLKYSDLTDDISRSVLMLSFGYRVLFRECFDEYDSVIKCADENPIIYVRCFAEASNENYSPLKFFNLCSFISEIFLFLTEHLVIKRKHHYIEKTMEALNGVFRDIFEKNFSQNGWTDIQNEASKIAKGFQYLEPFMRNDTSNATIKEMTDAILKENCENENEQQQTDAVTTGTPQAMVGVENPPNSVFWGTLISSDGLPINQTVFLTPVFPISFGTVYQNPQLSYLLNAHGNQTEVVTFLNQPSEVIPTLEKDVETIESSNLESHIQENLTPSTSEEEPIPSFRTVKLTESGDSVPCPTDDPVISEQELIDGDAQFQKYILSVSENESETSFQTIEVPENLGTEIYFADDVVILEQELTAEGEQFLKDYLCSSSKIEPVDGTTVGGSQDFKNTDIDCSSGTLTNDCNPEIETFSKEEKVSDPTSEAFLNEQNGNNLERDIFSKEDVSNPASESFSIEQNVTDSESEAFFTKLKINYAGSEIYTEENTLASENTEKVTGNQSYIFCQGQSNIALELSTTTTDNKIISKQDLNDGDEQFQKYVSSVSENESETSFQTVKKPKDLEAEIYTTDNVVSLEQELIEDEQFLKDSQCLSSKIEPLDETIVEGSQDFKHDDNDCRNATLSKENIPDCQTFSKEENVKDPEIQTFSKEPNVNDSECEVCLKELKVNDPDSDKYQKEKTLTSENAAKVKGCKSATLCTGHSNSTLQNLITNEAVSSQKVDLQEPIEIEINFPKDGDNNSTKIMHLNIGDKKLIFRIPSNMSLIFKFKAKSSSNINKQTQTL